MNDTQLRPLIIGFVADLMFTVKIESVAESLGYAVQWVENSQQLGSGVAGPELAPGDPRQLSEPLSGPAGALFDLLTRRRPALLVFDLGNAGIPWRSWLPLLKSAPSTRRIPIVCFGSHVEGDTLKAAKEAGADAVLARSRFMSALGETIQKYAQVPDYAGIAAACDAPLSELAKRGLEEFNHGLYFEAHETLEAAWNEDESPGRSLYQAILQVAVAYLQIERGNYNGALKMFLRSRQWIDPLPERCRGVDVARLRQDAERVHSALLALGQERMGELERGLMREVEWEENGD